MRKKNLAADENLLTVEKKKILKERKKKSKKGDLMANHENE